MSETVNIISNQTRKLYTSNSITSSSSSTKCPLSTAKSSISLINLHQIPTLDVKRQHCVVHRGESFNIKARISSLIKVWFFFSPSLLNRERAKNIFSSTFTLNPIFPDQSRKKQNPESESEHIGKQISTS